MQTRLSTSTRRRLVVSILLVLTVLLMLRLGVWQLDRAAEKQIILNQRIELSQEAIQSYKDIFQSNQSATRFLPVQAEGRYLNDHTLFIDNQVFDKRVGYQVVTPLLVDETLPLLLIARGWTAVGANRKTLPEVATPDMRLVVKGRLNTLFSKPPLWNDDYPVRDGNRWQYIDKSQIEAELGREIYPLMLELAPDFEGDITLSRRWDRVNDDWVAKHKGYAFQWFAMAFILVIFLLIMLVKLTLAKTEN